MLEKVDYLIDKYTQNNKQIAVDYLDCYICEPINKLFPKKNHDGTWKEETWAMELFFKGKDGERGGRLFAAVSNDQNKTNLLDRIALLSLKKVILEKLLDEYPNIIFSINVSNAVIMEGEWFFSYFLNDFTKDLISRKALKRVVLELQEMPHDQYEPLETQALLTRYVYLAGSSMQFAIDDAYSQGYVFPMTVNALDHKIVWYKMDYQYFQKGLRDTREMILRGIKAHLEMDVQLVIEGVREDIHKNILVEALRLGEKFPYISIQYPEAQICLTSETSKRFHKSDTAHHRSVQKFLQRLDDSLTQTNMKTAKVNRFENIIVPMKCQLETPGTHPSPTFVDSVKWARTHFDMPRDTPHCLIVADYGLGKSHLAKYIFRYLKKRWHMKGGPVPVLFPLGGYQPKRDEPKKLQAELLEYMKKYGYPVRDILHLDELLANGSIDLILDGVDEIPLIQNVRDPTVVFASLVKYLPQTCRCLLTSRKGVLAPLLLQDLQPYGIPRAEIRPWDQDQWNEFVGLCLKQGIFDTTKEFDEFKEFIDANPSLAELTSTPLYGRMLVEAHKLILNTIDLDLTSLYQTYVETVLELRKSGDLKPAERVACLQALAAFLSQKRRGYCTLDDLAKFINHYVQSIGAEQLSLFLYRDLQTYSLLNVNAISTSDLHVEFSHKSFYEYFLACDVLLCLQQENLSKPEPSDSFSGVPPFRRTCSANQLLEMGVLEFIGRLLRKEENSGLLNRLGTILTLQPLSRYVEPVVRRNIALAVGLSTGSLDDVSLPMGSEFSALRLDNMSMQRASLNGLRASNASFFNTDLRDASLVRANLNCCDLRQTNLRNANLRFASLVNLRKLHPMPLLAGARLEHILVTKADLRYIISAVISDPECAMDGHDVVKSLEAQAILVDGSSPTVEGTNNNLQRETDHE